MKKSLQIFLVMAIAVAFCFMSAEIAMAEKAIRTNPNNPGGPMLLDSGGPDAFGYTWIDSNDPSGPFMDWVDISSIGTLIPMGDDDVAGPFSLGFDFDFYGTAYAQFWVCSNGFGSFISIPNPGGYIYWENLTIPQPPSPGVVAGAAVYNYWTDLDPTMGGNVYYYAGSDSFIVTWDAIQPYGGGDPSSVQIVLTADGRITCHYATAPSSIEYMTVGIQNENGTIGLEVVYDAPYLEDFMAILFEGPTLAVDDNIQNPHEFSLSANYPNPFNASTTIEYRLESESDVSIDIFDLLGNKLESLTSERQTAGKHSIIWNADVYSSGIYFYRIQAGNLFETRKMTLLK